MNEIVKIVDNRPVTDTITLAEGSGSEHKAVIQLVRNYLNDLEEFGRVTFEMAPFNTLGGEQKKEIAILNEHQATLLLTYMKNTERIRTFKKKLVKAFFEMAEKIKSFNDDPIATLLSMSTSQILQIAADQAKQIEEARPKVQAFDRISLADGMNCITDAAKILQVRPKDLFVRLSVERWIYRRPGGKGWIAYQDKIQKGLLTHKITTVTDVYTGKDKTIEQVLVTPRGIAKLAEHFQEVAA